MNRSVALVAVALVMGACATAVNEVGVVADDWDVIVVGGGLMGSSTAWKLAESGQRVLLLEKQGAVYDQGSSFGEARIARSLGPPGDIWSYMHNRTVTEVEGVVEYLRSLGQDASMEEIYATSPVNYVRLHDRLAGYDYLPDQPDRYEIATTPAEGESLFGLAMPENTFIVREYKEHSGTISPAALIAMLHRATTLRGGEVAYEQRVTALRRVATGYELEIESTTSAQRRTLTVPKVVTAAGPYTGELLGEAAPYFDDLVTPQRVFLAFFEVAPEFWNALSIEEQQRLRDLFPAINSTVPTRAGANFSMIERNTERGTPLLKIGGHFQRSDIEDLDAVWALELTDEEKAWGRDSLLRHLALLGLDLGADDLLFDSGYSCVYSLTSTEVPYVTPAVLPDGTEDPNLVVVAGLSGVGAKGALAYGVLAADLVLNRVEPDEGYARARDAFGFTRLVADIEARDE